MAKYLHYRDVKKESWSGGIFVNLAKSTAPTIRPDSVGALAAGDLYFNTTDNLLYAHNGTSWNSVGTSGAGTLNSAYSNGNTIAVQSSKAIAITDSDTDATKSISISKTAAGTGAMFDLSTTASYNGNAINIDLTNADTAAAACNIKGQAAVRVTNALFTISEQGTGAVPALSISGDAASTGPLLQIKASAAVAPVANTNGMMTLDMTSAATGTQGFLVIGPAAARTGGAIRIKDAGTSSGPHLDLSCSSTSSAKIIKFATTGAITGSVLNIDMSNSGVAAQAVVVKGQAAIRTTNALVSISEQGTGALATLTVTGDAASTGPLFSLTASAAVAPVANTNGMMTLDMSNAATAAQGLLIIGPAAGRTGAMLRLTDAGTSSGQVISIAQSSTSSASAIKYTTSGAVTGKALDIDMTNAGVTAMACIIAGQAAIRTTNALVGITENGTGALATVNIAGAAASTGPLLSLTASAAVAPVANTNGMMTLDMSNAATAAQGLLIIGPAAARTGACLRIKDAGTSSGPCISIDQSSTSSAKVIGITYSGAATGAALDIAMANSGAAAIGVNISQATANITSQAIKITSLATATAAAIALGTHGIGASGVGAALDLGGSADLVAGADLVRISSTGSPSSTSNIVSIRQATGAGTAGAYALYISATGTNVEGLYVDDGKVVIDEELARYKRQLTSKTANYTVLATDSGTFFNTTGAAGEVDFTLPTAAAGLHYWFFNTVAQIMKIVAPAALLQMSGAAKKTSMASDATYAAWVYVVCDGTNWDVISSNTVVKNDGTSQTVTWTTA